MINPPDTERDPYWDQRIVELVGDIVPEEQRTAFYKWVIEQAPIHIITESPTLLLTDTDRAGYYMADLIGNRVSARSFAGNMSHVALYGSARTDVIKPLYIKFIDYGEVVNNDNPGITPTF